MRSSGLGSTFAASSALITSIAGARGDISGVPVLTEGPLCDHTAITNPRTSMRRILVSEPLNSTNEPGRKSMPAVSQPNRNANRKRGEDQQTARETDQTARRP